MAPFLDIHVPPEILQHIVRHLDPISLIALSQTSRVWRAFINPIHHDYAQRLLALELLPEHGIVPRFDERSQKLTPSWGSSEWESNKYACCGCMKLRTHMMFDNHAILRRLFRKPPPGSVEASNATTTDWEPLELSARWRHIQDRAAQAKEELEKCRVRVADWPREYAMLNPVPHPFARVPQYHDDINHEIEAHLVGTSRHKRRCVECQRRRGNWSRPNSHPGSKEAPAAKSRQLKFPSMWERHFPGLVERLPPESVPRIWRALRESTDGIQLSLYVLCCPSCDTWQEHSAFREWSLYQFGFGSPKRPKDPLLCNRCHLAAHQDPDLLAQELTMGALEMFRDDRDDTLHQLKFGWPLIHRDFNDSGNPNPPLAKFKAVGAEILSGLRWTSSTKQDIIIEDSDLPDLGRRFQRYREFIDHEVDSETRWRVLQSWFKLWFEDYDLYEKRYHWLNKQIAWLESDVKIVLNYVLKRDPYRI
ncbi:hypothetical protein C8A00DRAFT_18034 [Chaetomidium leptoderma]|uniref:F-box domain-containing protein n=1 Tax=Chaetomidium leptoderma TaxID=669021 RepID=A0AAN6ZVJ2_9PEZI|nr:hypothetical protein C8A00DRAFT_18034 [Chaetomidium leptoderma]